MKIGITLAVRVRYHINRHTINVNRTLALAATPVALFSAPIIAGFLTFGLIALLYLVTEELLVEAHEHPDSPLITAMFFVGFLGLLMIEEVLG